MKTIGYKDLATGKQGVINCYFIEGQRRHERINKALAELKHVGNIAVYLIKGNKTRRLFIRNF